MNSDFRRRYPNLHRRLPGNWKKSKFRGDSWQSRDDPETLKFSDFDGHFGPKVGKFNLLKFRFLLLSVWKLSYPEENFRKSEIVRFSDFGRLYFLMEFSKRRKVRTTVILTLGDSPVLCMLSLGSTWQLFYNFLKHYGQDIISVAI